MSNYHLNSIGAKSTLTMVKACCWLGSKPLPETGTVISMRSGPNELKIIAFTVCISIHEIDF